MAMVIFHRFDVLLISLDPSQGSEIKKTRPCVVISPDEMNQHIKTLIVAPITSSLKNYPTHIPLEFEGREGRIILSQIRTIDRSRVIKKLGIIAPETSSLALEALREMFM
jgi:mRNA interferase MazF